jgi:hypothetical protein
MEAAFIPGRGIRHDHIAVRTSSTGARPITGHGPGNCPKRQRGVTEFARTEWPCRNLTVEIEVARNSHEAPSRHPKD